MVAVAQYVMRRPAREQSYDRGRTDIATMQYLVDPVLGQFLDGRQQEIRVGMRVADDADSHIRPTYRRQRNTPSRGRTLTSARRLETFEAWGSQPNSSRRSFCVGWRLRWPAGSVR